MNTRTVLAPAVGVVLGLSGSHSLTSVPVSPPVEMQSASRARTRIVEIHLSTYQTTSDGKIVAGAPVLHALMQLDCDQKRYRRVGVDVEKSDGVILILRDNLGAHPWRSTTPGDPEALQLQAACNARFGE